MKATLKLLDGRPMTIKEKSSRPPQQQKKKVHAEISPGIGNAIEKKDAEGKDEDGERKSGEIDQEPMQSSPQSEICGVSERVQICFLICHLLDSFLIFGSLVLLSTLAGHRHYRRPFRGQRAPLP